MVGLSREGDKDCKECEVFVWRVAHYIEDQDLRTAKQRINLYNNGQSSIRIRAK